MVDLTSRHGSSLRLEDFYAQSIADVRLQLHHPGPAPRPADRHEILPDVRLHTNGERQLLASLPGRVQLLLGGLACQVRLRLSRFVVSVESASAGVVHLPHHGVQVERTRLLSWREFGGRLQLLCCQCLHWIDDEDVLGEPVPIRVGVLIGSLEGIPAQVEDLRQAHWHERFRPQLRACRSLLIEDSLPVSEANVDDQAVIVRAS